jgi:putative oxidoreductase
MTTHAEAAPARPTAQGKSLHIGLWVAQVLLALAFGMSGLMKLGTPYAELAAKFAWARATAEPLVKFIGIAEVTGALGLLLPSLTRIKPMLTPLAAAGFVVIMVLATALHLRLGEMPFPNFILGGLAAFVAWGRFRRAPILPRSGV